MPPVTEAEIRQCVREVADQPGTRLIDEFVVGERGRIDLAAIGADLRGFEIKSDLDSLYRLPRQMEVFTGVFDYCTLVITPRHLSAARAALRRGWGLSVVSRTSDGVLDYREVRSAKPNRAGDQDALAALLWRDEALAALDRLGAADGLRSKPRDLLWARLASVTTRDELRQIVTASLTERRGWRDVTEPHENAERSQPASASSRFLARRLRTRHG